MTPEEKLTEISHILELEWQEDAPKRGGGTTKVTVNNHAYYELEAVIQELRQMIKQEAADPGKGMLPDMIMVRTLEDVQMRIAEVMRIANEYRTKPGLHTKNQVDESSQEVRPDREGSN